MKENYTVNEVIKSIFLMPIKIIEYTIFVVLGILLMPFLIPYVMMGEESPIDIPNKVKKKKK